MNNLLNSGDHSLQWGINHLLTHQGIVMLCQLGYSMYHSDFTSKVTENWLSEVHALNKSHCMLVALEDIFIKSKIQLRFSYDISPLQRCFKRYFHTLNTLACLCKFCALRRGLHGKLHHISQKGNIILGCSRYMFSKIKQTNNSIPTKLSLWICCCFFT